MINIQNLNSYISTNGAIKHSLKHSSRPQEALEKLHASDEHRRGQSLRQYSEIAEENQQNKPTFSNKDNLSYSTQTAINQYTRNANLDMIEKTNELLGLSVYA